MTHKLLILILLVASLAACSPAAPTAAPVPPTATPVPPTVTSAPPTATAMLSPTNTPAPTNTPQPTTTLLPPLGGTGGGVIAFVSGRDGDQEIYIMPAPGPQAQVNADGSDQRRLTNDPSANGWPNWSPDGKQMAFQSNRSGALNIYVMDVLSGSRADDSKVSQLTNSQPGRGGSWEPAWSPDGKWIAYSAQQTSGSDIFLVNLDGTGRQRLTDNKAIDGAPAWSPDGRQIAFFSDRDGNWEIYVMPAPGPQAQVNADSSNVRRLTNHPGQDHSPTWSPDGTRIAFVSDRDGNEEIYLMDPDSANLRRLTHNKAEDWFPAWSPDGKWIAFSSNRDGNHEIYVMPADGSDQKRLTNNDAEDWGPVWRPKLP